MSSDPHDGEQPLPIDRFSYDLPEELIAQHPIEPRDASRLLILDRQTGAIADRIFRELPDLLNPGDLLVMNDTRVRSARLFTKRATGAKVELLLLKQIDETRWTALARPARRLKPGETLSVLNRQGELDGATVQFSERLGSVVEIELPDPTVVERCGHVPLPPYIHEHLNNPERYQTVFATELGSAAAPTAGLHFTPDLLDACREAGIKLANVTLHVGLDTFKPVTESDAREHEIHSEWFHVSAETLNTINQTRANGGRVIAVGTTVVRTLESIAGALDSGQDQARDTSLYITPGYEFQVIDGMITNFHLPRTTLLLLVSALTSWEHIRAAYEHAVRERYRFYSFGDAMLIM